MFMQCDLLMCILFIVYSIQKAILAILYCAQCKYTMTLVWMHIVVYEWCDYEFR